ncbi:MAG: DUF3276 family protein [Spirochaetaceae bacterium]|jgi:hypothetical protein|nr:DUF3276 family protein [Spirochaetaceae bacterium]
MGIRGELYSTKVQLQNRTYFFNVKENRMGDLYLNIVESKNRAEGAGGFERQSVILFAEDLREFLAGFDESLQVLERQVRERKKNRSALFRVDRDYEQEPSGERGGYRKYRNGGDGQYRQRQDGEGQQYRKYQDNSGDAPYQKYQDGEGQQYQKYQDNSGDGQYRNHSVKGIRRRDRWED